MAEKINQKNFKIDGHEITVLSPDGIDVDLLGALNLSELDQEVREVSGDADRYWCPTCNAYHTTRNADGTKKTPVQETASIVDQLIEIIVEKGAPTNTRDIEALHESIAGLNIAIAQEVRSGKITAAEAEESRQHVDRLLTAVADAGFMHTEEDEREASMSLARDYLQGVIKLMMRMEGVFYIKDVDVASSVEAIDIVKGYRDWRNEVGYGTLEFDERTKKVEDRMLATVDRIEELANEIIERGENP